jgi:hypothetical protein
MAVGAQQDLGVWPVGADRPQPAAQEGPDILAARKRSFESPDAGGHKQSFHEIFAMIRKNQVARIPANDIKTQPI